MGGSNAHELVLLDQAGQALAEARSLDEIKIIRNKAEAVRKYAQSASLGLDVQNRAAEVKLRAERQAGKLLAQLTLRGGDRRSKGHSDRLKLSDLGLTPNQSKRWQMQARIPESLFRDHVKQTCKDGKELTSAGLVRLAKQLKDDATARTDDANAQNGHDKIGDGSNGKIKSADDLVQEQQSAAQLDEMGGLISELKNHHKTLDGILSPYYSGEITSLRRVELRMLRYLLSETGTLLAQLDRLERKSAGCACHNDRPAL